MEEKKEHKCKESEGKIPFIRVNKDFTYTCIDCKKTLELEEVL